MAKEDVIDLRGEDNDKNPQLEEALKQNKALQEQLDGIADLMNMPEIKAVLDAKKSGKKVEVKPEDDIDESSFSLARLLADETSEIDGDIYDEEKEVNRKKTVNDLSNKELIDILADSVDKAIEGNRNIVSKTLEEKFDSFRQQNENTNRTVMQLMAALGVERAKAKFKDFDDYKDEIEAIWKKYPQMPIEDAYKFAKANKLSKAPPANEVETERENFELHDGVGNMISHMRPGGGRLEDEEEYEKRGQRRKPKNRQSRTGYKGKAGFRNLVQDALDKKLNSE